MKMMNVVKIGIACIAVSLFLACGDRNKCKDVSSNFEKEYAKYNELHKQFDEYLTQCMQIEGYEDVYQSMVIIGLSWGTDLALVIHIYDLWNEDTDIWENLTDSQQKLITEIYNIAIQTREQGRICAKMVLDNPDCLGDKEEFNEIC